MASNKDDDDFSPKDAFNMFTTIYRDHLKAPEPPPQVFHHEDPRDITADTSLLTGVTLAGPMGARGGGPPPDLLLHPGIQVSAVDPAGWIFSEKTDTVILPLVLSTIGLFAVASNLFVLWALVGLRRMRSGPNLMLANLAMADLCIILAAVPTAVASRLRGPAAVSTLACRFVHYVIFVSVYVSMYTLVVVCVFGFFTELLRGGDGGGSTRRRCSTSKVASGGADGAAPVPLSVCSAGVSSIVIWAAFAASHLTFVVQSDVAGLAAFEEPLICVYGASVDSEDGEPTRTRTLWVTFLACAFLLPLTIVCCLSAAVLRFQRRRRHQFDGACGTRLPRETTSGGCNSAMETTQNLDNDGRGQRELTVLVMASTVVRTVCWLPLQIFVLTDVFGPETGASEPEAGVDGAHRRKWELFCVCAALTGSCLSLPLLRVASTNCRDAFRLVLRRCCRQNDSIEDHRNINVVRRLQMVPSSPCTPPRLSAATCRRHCSYQPDDEFVAGRPKHLSHLSLPPPCRQSVPDVNETILSIISDSSNHINYA